MTIAALRALLDQELPDVPRHPAPRLNLPHWSAKEHDTMTDTDIEPRPDGACQPSGNTLADILAWALHHNDTDVQALGEQARTALAALYERRDRDAELARIEKELAAIDSRAEQLRDRQAELLPPAPKKRPSRVDYPAADVRAWARTAGLDCPATGRVPAAVVQAWRDRGQEN